MLRPISSSSSSLKEPECGVDPMEKGLFTEEHQEMMASLNKLIEKEINPYVDEWEEARMFPAHQVSLADHRCALFSEGNSIALSYSQPAPTRCDVGLVCVPIKLLSMYFYLPQPSVILIQCVSP